MAPTTVSDPLLLVPGLMCDRAVWQPVIPALAAGRVCTVLDHGSADSLVTMARQLLDGAPPRFALAGHSMGGRVALEVVRLAPERVSRLALLDTGYLLRPPGPAGEEEARKRFALLQLARENGVRAMALEWVQGMVHPDRLADGELLERIVAMFERHSAQTFEHQITALLARPDASDVLPGLAVPTLVLCGRQDSWAPPTQHQALQGLAPGAVLEIVEACGHMAPMERPDAVAAAMQRWLAG
jgi:pimeloyl-ACP methyl ester carboxylesterase